MRHRVLVALAVVASLTSVLSIRTVGQEGPPAGRQGGPPPVQLPEGVGREVVQAQCARCHGLNLITNSWGYTKDGWQDRISTMVALAPDQVNLATTYLGTHFPSKQVSGAVLISGPVTATIREWQLPTLGSRPHDPLSAADGSIWWTGMYANRLGRLDPRTGAMKEFPLKTAGSGPHGLVEDKAGNIWFTAIQQNYIGKLDPKTGDVTEYKITEPGTRGPHTPIMDQKGALWFTLQSGHVGRLIPATGDMKVVAPPSTPTYPYGIQINSQGVPWYVDFRGNRISSVDPATMVIKEYTLPDAAARPRRLAITTDDAIWYTDYARGYLGRFDPKTGAVKEWLSPGGKESDPYGIAAVGNIVWYSESGVRPNTLVRFDPQGERFQTWAIGSGGGVIRHMMATRNGNLVLACSGVNRVALVEVGAASNRTN